LAGASTEGETNSENDDDTNRALHG
jgi:hypothetical protein